MTGVIDRIRDRVNARRSGISRADLHAGLHSLEHLDERLADWAETDLDEEATVHGIDIGRAIAHANEALLITDRSLLHEAVVRLTRDADLTPAAKQRLAEVVDRYFPAQAKVTGE